MRQTHGRLTVVKSFCRVWLRNDTLVYIFFILLSHTIRKMIVSTVLLLILLAVLLPLRITAYVAAVPDALSADIRVRLFGIPVFVEHVSVRQGMLVFEGSVGECIRIVDINLLGGNELVKAINLKRIDVLVRPSLLATPQNVALMSALGIVSGHLAAFTHVDVGSVVSPTVGDTQLCMHACLYTDLLELGICLIRNYRR